MKLTDYVVDFFVNHGITHVFGLTGGAVVHIFDSVDKHPCMEPVFCHHEQAAALASVAYARIKCGLGLAVVTTGPGGSNAITGVVSAWQDSIPCVFLSGQSRKRQTSYGKPLRQVGSQELNIVSVVKSITKYAAMIEEVDQIRYHLEKAVFLATHGRPGPVWLDIPLDFQWAQVTPDQLIKFDPAEVETFQVTPANRDSTAEHRREVLDLLSAAERPLLLAGYGVRLAHAEEQFRRLVEMTQIPYVSSWTASDIVSNEHPLYVGRVGITGQRGGNLAVQNCDLLIAIGSHLSIPLTGTRVDAFARDAKIVVVNVDQDAMDGAMVRVDRPVLCDAKVFLTEMIEHIADTPLPDIDMWRRRCMHYRQYNHPPKTWWDQTEYVNPYIFMEALSNLTDSEDIVVVDGGGTNLYISFQGYRVKQGQRLTLSSGICAMGTGLPESIGACFANNRKRTICTIGDGSLQLNIQEFQTIVHHNLPIKIFVMNNRGYLAIRHTQREFLDSNYVGSCPEGSLTLPDFVAVAEA
jgi:acetolactate synthase-1/2/3 large subunit